MKLRLFTGLACALALGGCASYGYVDDGGGYYSGGSSVQYNHVPGYGGYGYGVYGYGSPYYGYRYTPGWALGVGYGSPYYYPRHYGYPGGGYYRPPHHHPRPPVHPPRPGGQPDGPPPHADASPPLDRAPWRDLERIVEANEPRPPRPPRADAIGGGVGGMPRADGQ